MSKYLPVSGASDEALELTAALACDPSANAAAYRGAGFSLLVFEPLSPAAVVSRDVRLSSDGERVKTMTIPYALFGPGPLIATVENFSLQGPCKVISSLRQVETSGGRTRSGITNAQNWRVNAFKVELASTQFLRAFDDGTGIPLNGSTDETMQFIFAAVCAVNTDNNAESDGSKLSLQFVAREPTGTVSPFSMDVTLRGGAPAPGQREHILLARQVGVPYNHFYSRQSGPVLFQIKDVETTPGCHMLPIIAQRTDTDTGKTKSRNTPFFNKYRPQFYFR